MARRAFTLIELLCVVAIIALLAGIIFPVFIAVRRRADHTACAENLHQLGLAVTLYANDHEGWVPPATTDQMAYEAAGKIPPADIEASPAILRAAMTPYVKNEAVWFCPADQWRGKPTLYLSQRHLLTSYRFYPITEGQIGAWPPRMQLMRDPLSNAPPKSEDVPLLSDAMGLPWLDSDPQFEDEQGARSNHPDNLVNAIRHDLSLTRLPSKFWNGTKD